MFPNLIPQKLVDRVGCGRRAPDNVDPSAIAVVFVSVTNRVLLRLHRFDTVRNFAVSPQRRVENPTAELLRDLSQMRSNSLTTRLIVGPIGFDLEVL